MNCLRFLFLMTVILVVFGQTQVADAQEQPDVASDEQVAATSFPSQVSHRPGMPQKPLIERPGDRNASSNPSRRYAMPDRVRSGTSDTLGLWARPSLNPQYSAGFAGGSTRSNSPHSRPRNQQEGTWGLDFTLWGQPKLAWLRWSDGSHHQANGNFETDR